MSGLIDKIGQAFTATPMHEVPKIEHAKRILLVLSSATPQMPDHRSGYFWAEAYHPYEVFVKHGWDVDIISETGSATPDEASLTKMATASDKHHWEDKKFIMHAKLAQIRPASAVDVSQYAAIYFAGGHACCEDFPRAVTLQKLAAQIYEAGGVVGAVCHGPAIFDGLILPSTGKSILAGKTATGFSTTAEQKSDVLGWMRQHNYKTMEEIVSGAGGKWEEHASNPMAEFVRTDARVCTGMNPASAAKVAKEMLEFLPKNNDYTPQAIIDNTHVAAGHSVADQLRKTAMEQEEREKSSSLHAFPAAGTRNV